MITVLWQAGTSSQSKGAFLANGTTNIKKGGHKKEEPFFVFQTKKH